MFRPAALLVALIPAAAAAHPGAHLHPHGAEIPAWLLVALVAAAALAIGLALGTRR